MPQSFVIDIASKNHYPINLGKQWCIQFPTPPSGSFKTKRSIDKKVFIQRESLKIEGLKVDCAKLFSVIHDGEEFYLTDKDKEIELKSDHTYFQLFLNPEAIKDCEEQQVLPIKQYKIELSILLKNEKKGKITSYPETIYVKFAEIHSRPKVEIVLDDKFKEIRFSPVLLNEKIGTLKISNPSEYKYFPNLDGKVSFYVSSDGVDAKKLASTIALNKTMVDSEFILFDEAKQSVNEFSFSNLEMNNCIDVPIMADFVELGNPYDFPEGQQYKLSASVEYWHTGNPSSKEQSVPIEDTMTVFPDMQKIDLGVYVKDWETEVLAKIENNCIHTVSKVEFVPGDDIHFTNMVYLRNQAELGAVGTGVEIKDIIQEIVFFPNRPNDEKSSLIYSSDKLKDKDVFIKERPNTFLQCDSKRQGQCELRFGFFGKDIKEVCSPRDGEERYEVDVHLKLSFKYRIIEYAGQEGGYDVFNCTIVMPIFQKPYREWLGIDFGTSAIVGVYGTNNVLDLRKVKAELFGKEVDVYEEGTKFLPSNVIFQHNALALIKDVKKEAEKQAKKQADIKKSSDGAKQTVVMGSKSQLLSDGFDSLMAYKMLAICLSPTSSHEDRNARYILPCLKLLVGYDLIPNCEKYRDFRYCTNLDEIDLDDDKPGTALFSEKNDGTIEYSDLAHVDFIFKEVYSELFYYYVQKCLEKGGMKKLNNVILTYPNTYTIRHLEILENIVKNSLKDLNLRHIKFVSESDAVACYYQSHKYQLNPKSYDRETVVVYDMGAGTLDVTLFEIVKSNHKTTINIKGKIGFAKAGNYLDAVIAKLLAMEFKSLERVAFQENINGDSLPDARYLKQYIKSVIKPVLGKSDSVMLKKEEAGKMGMKKDEFNLHNPNSDSIELDLNTLIRNKEEYKKFISDCTSSFFDNFFRFLGYKGNNRPHIDTVIVSGRSAKLSDVQVGLKESIKHWNGDRDDFTTIDLSQLEDGEDCSKTAVVEGALDYARLLEVEDASTEISSRNVMAKFGVKYKDSNGRICYKELLNPYKDKPVYSKHLKEKGMVVDVYMTNYEDLELSAFDRKISLVQTYSSNTEKDYEDGNTEYITVIKEYECYSSNVRLRLEVNEDNQLFMKFVGGGTSSGVTTTHFDLNSPSNKMSLWPMLN